MSTCNFVLTGSDLALRVKATRGIWNASPSVKQAKTERRKWKIYILSLKTSSTNKTQTTFANVIHHILFWSHSVIRDYACMLCMSLGVRARVRLGCVFTCLCLLFDITLLWFCFLTYIHTYLYPCIHICTHIHTHTHKHTYTQKWPRCWRCFGDTPTR